MTDESMWIRTEPTIDSKGYVVTLTIGSDWAVTLTPVRAKQYAAALLTAVAQAEYDAAILGQLTKGLGVADDVAVQMVMDLRAERPEVAGPGVNFVPGVSQRKRHPFIQIVRDGEPIGQFDAPAARRHAFHVLEAPAVADLDAAYLKVLRSMVGVDEDRARQVVADLGNYRDAWAVDQD